MKWLLILVIIIFTSPSIAEVTSSGFNTTVNTVGLRLGFNIDNKTNDAITTSNQYITSEGSGITVAITSSGGLGTKSDIDFSTNDYSIELRDKIDNRFIISFVNGSSNDVTDKLDSFPNRQIPTFAFGTLAYNIPPLFPLFFRLDYDSINIISRLRIPTGVSKILISNLGKDSRDLNQISMVIK